MSSTGQTAYGRVIALYPTPNGQMAVIQLYRRREKVAARAEGLNIGANVLLRKEKGEWIPA